MADHASDASPAAVPVSDPTAKLRNAGRFESIDLLRGLVMVVMALDHVLDYFSSTRFDPFDLSQTTPGLALTRWATHICAPVFVFLAGTSAFLSFTKGKPKRALARFLLARGVWLIFLELTVIRFAWMFNNDYAMSFGQVIWAIGWSMVALAALIYLPVVAVAAVGVIIILGHNLLDAVTSAEAGSLGWLWSILHTGDAVAWAPGYVFYPGYPLLPWIGVMAAGFGFGKVMQLEEAKRRQILWWLGGSLTAGFFLLRVTNLYGDPVPWTSGRDWVITLLSFINVQKYPPSLLFLLVTLGPALGLLALFERWRGRLAGVFVTYGRVPLFYYVIHLYLIHLVAVLAAWLSGADWHMMFGSDFPGEWAEPYGFGLPVIYGIWTAIVVGLYPLCRWFAGVKRRHPGGYLSYL